jgi:hypothetical protein
VIALAGAVLLLAASGTGARAGNACTADATRTLIHSFVRNYSAGRVAVINRMWAPEPRFRWFSSGKPGARLGPPAYVRSTLARYFRSRVRVHEHLRLTELRARYDPRRKIVNFFGTLVRSADDIHSPALHDFKGAADCLSGRPTLIVWSM